MVREFQNAGKNIHSLMKNFVGYYLELNLLDICLDNIKANDRYV